MSSLESFERAFSSGCSGCRRDCECGRVFFADDGLGYDWEDGELETLRARPDATPLAYSVGTILLGGKEYCIDCPCWHPVAQKMMDWLDENAGRIAEYLTLEKKRKQSEADDAPVVR